MQIWLDIKLSYLGEWSCNSIYFTAESLFYSENIDFKRNTICSTEIFLAAVPALNSATTNTIIHIQYNKYMALFNIWKVNGKHTIASPQKQICTICSFKNACALQILNIKSPLVLFYRQRVSMEISIKCLVYFQLFSSVSLSLSHGCPQWPCRGGWGQFEPWVGTAVLPCFTHPVRCLQQGQEQQLSHRESFCIWPVTTEHSLTQRAEFILRESWTCKM